MMKSEFEKRLPEGYTVTNEDYSKIEYVYTWHPCIDPVKGKDQIVYLYVTFGMRIIHDMMESASEAESLNNDLRELLYKQEELKQRMDCLKRGVRYDPES